MPITTNRYNTNIEAIPVYAKDGTFESVTPAYVTKGDKALLEWFHYSLTMHSVPDCPEPELS
jgi:hypothetical protein